MEGGGEEGKREREGGEESIKGGGRERDEGKAGGREGRIGEEGEEWKGRKERDGGGREGTEDQLPLHLFHPTARRLEVWASRQMLR